MLHMMAAYASISNAAAFQQIAGLGTQIDYTRDSNLVVPRWNHVVRAMYFGANISRGQIQARSLASMAYPEIKPLSLAAAAAYERQAIADFIDNPIPLVPNEELGAYAQQGSAGAQDAYALFLMSDERPKPVGGTPFTLRYTSTATLTAKQWSLCTLTADQQLGAGRYHVVGARCKSAGALAFRLIFQDQPNRPGGFAVQSDNALDPLNQRNGELGLWGTFSFDLLPNLEVLSTSADTSEVLDLDVVKA